MSIFYDLCTFPPINVPLSLLHLPFYSSSVVLLPLSTRRWERGWKPAAWDASSGAARSHSHTCTHSFPPSFYTQPCPFFTPHGQIRSSHQAWGRLYPVTHTHTHTHMCPCCMNTSCVKKPILSYSVKDFKQICWVCASCLPVCSMIVWGKARGYGLV